MANAFPSLETLRVFTHLLFQIIQSLQLKNITFSIEISSIPLLSLCWDNILSLFHPSIIEKYVTIATKMFCISILFIFMPYAPIVYVRPCYPPFITSWAAEYLNDPEFQGPEGSFTMALGALNLIIICLETQQNRKDLLLMFL